MHPMRTFPSVTFAIVTYAAVALLIWIGFVPGSTPSTFRSSPEYPSRIMIFAGLSLLILATLVPVLWRSTGTVRRVSVLFSLFPALVLALAGVWLYSWIG
jgi:hypothetical protein